MTSRPAEDTINLSRLTAKAKNLIDKRGGTAALKEDAAELKDIVSGPGSASQKAKRAADAVKDPGARGPDGAQGQDGTRKPNGTRRP